MTSHCDFLSGAFLTTVNLRGLEAAAAKIALERICCAWAGAGASETWRGAFASGGLCRIDYNGSEVLRKAWRGAFTSGGIWGLGLHSSCGVHVFL